MEEETANCRKVKHINRPVRLYDFNGETSSSRAYEVVQAMNILIKSFLCVAGV